MNTENETGVKVPKGQINYNTVAGSLGLAAFAGLGLRNWLGNGNGSVAYFWYRKFMGSVFGLDLSTYNLLNELDFIIEPTLDYIIKPQLAKLSKFIPDEQIPKVVNSYLDAAISKATAKGSVNLFGFEFEATAFQNLKREIDNSLKNNVSHDERPT